MPDAPVAATTLQNESRAAWNRYVADHVAARDAMAATIAQLRGRLAAATDPTRKASLRTRRTDLITRWDLFELKFTAANAGEGRVKAPTREEVADHQQKAADIAAGTADNLTTSAIVQTATRVANEFSRLHLNP